MAQIHALTPEGRLPTAAVAHVQEMTTEATWFKGAPASGDTLASIADGSYRVSSAATATSLGLPEATHGVVESWTNPSGSWGFQAFTTIGGNYWVRFVASGTWGAWRQPAPFWSRGTLDSGSDADALLEGSYRVTSSGAATDLGLPEAQQGLIESWDNGSRSWVFQRFTTILGSRWTRVYTGGQWLAWAPLAAGGGDWYKRALDSTDNIDALDSGAYRVAAGSVSTALGLPGGAHGIVEVWQNGSLTWGLRKFTTLAGAVWTASISGGAWTPWHSPAATGGGSDLTMSRGVQRQSQALAIFRARMMRHATEPIPIVFAGDSETRGEGATSNATRYVDRLVTYLQGKYPSTSGSESTVQDRTGGAPFTPFTGPGIHGYCMGRGGTQADTYLTDADTVNIAAIDPAMIIHQVALNDYARHRPIAQYRADLIHRIDHLNAALTRPCVHVFSLTYPRQDVAVQDPAWHEYGDALRSIAAERPESVAFLDMSPAFAAMGIPGTDPFGLLVADQIHTSDDGYEMMADCVAIGIEEK